MDHVAPYIGAWIEIHEHCYITNTECVAPYIDTWIEIEGVDYV
ncbi:MULTISPECIES: hypothetical protein [Bacillus cereus group]|nr:MULTISPECIES: hypothetical protein [Bacillus cereus group]